MRTALRAGVAALLAAPALVVGSTSAMAAAPESSAETVAARAKPCGQSTTARPGETKFFWRNCTHRSDYIKVDHVWAPDQFHCVPAYQIMYVGSAVPMGPPIGNVRGINYIKPDCTL
ncbi:hypothetical protein CLV30_11637 [Haloactinopolyspora alba]|uniref:Secreted protein n=1 Tax=Haloactinopolyspora alba TaxID=648780 RepID=A0A2P8DT34_9ACTN|nr:hypothetical protein [Haloactinopolyspora alba]PSL00377.1 hypothetical protein CLV30_11637 [Haloactinopolyspora alba]